MARLLESERLNELWAQHQQARIALINALGSELERVNGRLSALADSASWLRTEPRQQPRKRDRTQARSPSKPSLNGQNARDHARALGA